MFEKFDRALRGHEFDGLHATRAYFEDMGNYDENYEVQNGKGKKENGDGPEVVSEGIAGLRFVFLHDGHAFESEATSETGKFLIWIDVLIN